MDYAKIVAEKVRQNETEYISGITTISKYVEFSLSENINKIDAYLNSSHISGKTDSMGREKPFFNIVTAAVNAWYRATDIDRKDIRLKATKVSDMLAAFIATIHLQNWMRKVRFGTFLNDWGSELSSYGSSIVKFVEKSGELYAEVIPWNRLIVDSVELDKDVVIEVLELTPSELRKRKGYDQDMVEALVDAADSRELIDKERVDNKDGYIKVYEVHGEMPLSYITGKEDDEGIYAQQMHVISFLATKEGKGFDDYCLMKGRETKSPYMNTHLKRMGNRVQSKGAVEELFEAQWMMNHTAKSIKDQLDLASKLIFQTSDGNFIGQNALDSIETGDIMIHAINQPLTQLANTSHDITSLQNFGSQWKANGNEQVNVSEAMLGATPPSGTAWRQTEAVLQQSHSLFAQYTENKGLHIEDMMREYIIPHLKKKMDTTDEISATLEAHDIAMIDKMYVPREAAKVVAKQATKDLLSGATPEDLIQKFEGEKLNVQEALAKQGNQRFFKPDEIDDSTWKEIFEDFEWNIEVEVTGEASDKQTILTTLTTVYANIINNPEQKENAQLVFKKILETTGVVSPIEMASQTQQPQLAPQSGGVGASITELPDNLAKADK